MSTILNGYYRVHHPFCRGLLKLRKAVKIGARRVLHHYLYLRSISPVGVDAALSRRRSRVRVPYGPQIVRSPLVGDTSPRLSHSKADSLWQSCNRFESYPDYNSVSVRSEEIQRRGLGRQTCPIGRTCLNLPKTADVV